MRRVLPFVAAATLLTAPVAWAEKTVTIWLPGEIQINPATTRIATVSKSEGKVKLGAACAKKADKYETWGAMVLDLGMGTTQFVEVASEKLPGTKGIGVDLSSLRAEGECTEAGRKWRRYSAVVGEPAPAKAKPPTEKKEKPKPDEKKKDK